jgi:hypothetical protein
MDRGILTHEVFLSSLSYFALPLSFSNDRISVIS